MSVTDALKMTLSSKEFQADAKNIIDLAVKLGAGDASGFDVARLVVSGGDIIAKLSGEAGEIGEAIPMLGAMIQVLEIAQTMVVSSQRDQRIAQATAFERRDWTIHPSGVGGALVAADLPPAFDVLLLTFGTGRTTGDGYVGGGRTISEGAIKRQTLAKDENAANAPYLKSFMHQGQSLTGVPYPQALIEDMFGRSIPVPKIEHWESPPPVEIERYLKRIGKMRRAQRLHSQKVGAVLLQVQLMVAYGAALVLAKNPADTHTWDKETKYMQRRTLLACWLDSPLNSEPDGLKLRLSMLLPLVRSMTNARYGAMKASKGS